MCKLFFMCPECFLEDEVIDVFGENSYFLTSLGAIFDEENLNYTENIQHLFRVLSIKQVYVLQSTECDFINQSFDSGRKKIGINAEEKFRSNYRSLIEQPVVSISREDRKNQLAEAHLANQLEYIRNVISCLDREVGEKPDVLGLMYDKKYSIHSQKPIRKL